jgi:hypothetical protein
MRGVVSARVRLGESIMTGGIDSEAIDIVRITVIIDDVDFADETVPEVAVCGRGGLDGLASCIENSGGNEIIPGWIGCSAMQEA